MILPDFKIRASAAGSIMAGSIGLSETQERKLQTFQDKIKSGKALTDLQHKESHRLIDLQDNPELPKGAKTYCDGWIKEQIYERRKEFTSKYTDKGNFTEDWSIEWLSTKRLIQYVKNEENFSNEWMTGTPDIVGKDIVIDVKNSYDFSTFPLFDYGITNKDYYYQLMVYMELTGLQWSELTYTLNDLPHHLIEREARSQAWSQGGSWDDHFEACRDRFTYGDIDDKFKIKTFLLQIDKPVIEEIKSRVELCRQYIKVKSSQF